MHVSQKVTAVSGEIEVSVSDANVIATFLLNSEENFQRTEDGKK